MSESASDLLTIDELAQRTGLTTRNIRAYQSRGLVPHPVKQGRTGYYGPEHIERLELIRELREEGLALDVQGFVSEGSGQNLFLVRDGVLYTPPLAASVLGGITRDSVITLARELGFEVRESMILREQLYLADELFLCGTAVEITPVRSVDRITIGGGTPGPITQALQKRFFGILHGEVPDTHGWLTYVNQPVPAAAR